MNGFFDEILYHYALSFVGVPYRWGGSDPIDGYDCSGLVLELLSSCGVVKRGVDMTAQGLFDVLHYGNSLSQVTPTFGSIVFYGQGIRAITHVSFALDRFRVIEAGGGGSATTSIPIAAKQDAFVRISHIDHRGDRVAILRPSYAKIGAQT